MDAVRDKQLRQWEKMRQRSARRAQRKLARIKAKLAETGDLTDWESEFSQSVDERLDMFGSAFQDLEKGRPGEALSFAQKKVLSAMYKKSRQMKAAASSQEAAVQGGYNVEKSAPKRPYSTFKKRRPPQPSCDDQAAMDNADNMKPHGLQAHNQPHSAEKQPVCRYKPFLRLVDNGADQE